MKNPQEQSYEIHRMETFNRQLMRVGLGQILFVLFFSLYIVFCPVSIDRVMSDGGPWGRPALEKLDSITPETNREAYILSVFRDIIPLPIVAVKNSFIRSTLMWLFVTGLMILWFARHQRKQLELIKAIMNGSKSKQIV